MIRIKEFYFVDTVYGINMVAETHTGDYLQQVHVSLENQGGGAAKWEPLEKDEHGNPVVLNIKL